MKLGFTATRKGCTSAQLKSAAEVLERLRPSLVNQGCCLGGDAELTQLLVMKIADESLPECTVVGHPSTNKGMTSEVALTLCDEVHQPLPPLERNGNIVANSEALLACPETAEEVVRSGTWATIRKARKHGLPIYLILPDGTIRDENTSPLR